MEGVDEIQDNWLGYNEEEIKIQIHKVYLH